MAGKPNVYDQHQKAFTKVSAYLVLMNGERIATVAFKHGDARTDCYLHVIGVEMTRGWANGGGYDKNSAACWLAARLSADKAHRHDLATGAAKAHAQAIARAVKDEGAGWDRDLRDAGYDVLQAI